MHRNNESTVSLTVGTLLLFASCGLLHTPQKRTECLPLIFPAQGILVSSRRFRDAGRENEVREQYCTNCGERNANFDAKLFEVHQQMLASQQPKSQAEDLPVAWTGDLFEESTKSNQTWHQFTA